MRHLVSLSFCIISLFLQITNTSSNVPDDIDEDIETRVKRRVEVRVHNILHIFDKNQLVRLLRQNKFFQEKIRQWNRLHDQDE
ncbi:hypothetical protein AB6A40_006953 [Gnathostoma spinigerum]|uniref:Uncharacterized protein n=1 Tax=Gnathostoma spinigerum TaxID=75299 RepID=A0ABD6EQ01_9BILA